jgi:hypothetical protein
MGTAIGLGTGYTGADLRKAARDRVMRRGSGDPSCPRQQSDQGQSVTGFRHKAIFLPNTHAPSLS